MALIYKLNESYAARNYAAETAKIIDALVTPGQEDAEVTMASLTAAEVKTLLLKCDMLVSNYQNQAISVAVAEAFPVILAAVRMVKAESKQPFRGIRGMGRDLDIKMLRPEDVGGAILSPSSTIGAGTTGLYGGVAGGVYTWLKTFVAGTSDDMIPSQTMKEEGACVHIGILDTVEVPKTNEIKFTLAGVAAPAQSIALNYKDGTTKTAFSRFELPVLVGPEMTQKIDIDPYISGDAKPELVSFIIGMASDLTFA